MKKDNIQGENNAKETLMKLERKLEIQLKDWVVKCLKIYQHKKITQGIRKKSNQEIDEKYKIEVNKYNCENIVNILMTFVYKNVKI